MLPNSAKIGYGSLISKPGFVVAETVGYGGEDELTFKTEDEVIQYILPKIAERVAYYEHQKYQSEDR